MSIPDVLKYTKDHEWVKIDGDFAYIGITNYAQGELGDIVFIEFPNINDSFIKGEVFGTIEAVKTVADLFIPVTGKVVEINNALENCPELINSDPYNNGWIIKIAINNNNDLEDLLDSDSYKKII